MVDKRNVLDLILTMSPSQFIDSNEGSKSNDCQGTADMIYHKTFLYPVFSYSGNKYMNGYHYNKWNQQPKFKSWSKLFAFYFLLIPFGKA